MTWQISNFEVENCNYFVKLYHFCISKGNKKGPVGRWDFETTEEYSDYMSMKEAMPKAAFQVCAVVSG